MAAPVPKRDAGGIVVRAIDAEEQVVVAVIPEHGVIRGRPEPKRVIVVGVGPEVGAGPERAGEAGALEETWIELPPSPPRTKRARRKGLRVPPAERTRRDGIEGVARVHRRAAQRLTLVGSRESCRTVAACKRRPRCVAVRRRGAKCSASDVRSPSRMAARDLE